jgi:hypothetical protein
MCDECQGPGLRGQTSTALVHTGVLPYYKGKKFILGLAPKDKTYGGAQCSMGWVLARPPP